MGVMEHNIDINFARRLKGQGKCWSIDEVNKMAKILAIKANKGMYEIVDNIVSFGLTSEKLSEIKEERKIVAQKYIQHLNGKYHSKIVH